jgi:hypothetical protein
MKQNIESEIEIIEKSQDLLNNIYSPYFFRPWLRFENYMHTS